MSVWSAAAPAWGEHAEMIDGRGRRVTEELLDRAGVGPGDEVLEIACGPGGVGLAAADRVGPTGRVVMSDIAPEMTAIANERARRLGLTNVSSIEVDLDQLDLESQYDAIVGREGLMFAADPVASVRGLHRALRPGGRISVAVWGRPALNPWMSTVLDAVSAHMGMPVPPPGVPGPFSLSDDGLLASVLTEGGFQDVDVVEVPEPFRAPRLEGWWSTVTSLAGPLGMILASMPAEVAADMRAKAEVEVAEWISDDGALELPGMCLVGSGRR